MGYRNSSKIIFQIFKWIIIAVLMIILLNLSLMILGYVDGFFDIFGFNLPGGESGFH